MKKIILLFLALAALNLNAQMKVGANPTTINSNANIQVEATTGQQFVIRLVDKAHVPFDPANTDYANFKKDLANGAQLQDADGNVIDGIAYLKELA